MARPIEIGGGGFVACTACAAWNAPCGAAMPRSRWAAGCYRVFTETASGARADRPILEQLLDQLRPGDTLVVWKLDRLGR